MHKRQAHKKAIESSTTYRVLNFDTDLHVMPIDDIIKHLPDCNCPCNCYHDPVNKAELAIGIASKHVWIHRRISSDENKH